MHVAGAHRPQEGFGGTACVCVCVCVGGGLMQVLAALSTAVGATTAEDLHMLGLGTSSIPFRSPGGPSIVLWRMERRQGVGQLTRTKVESV